jgi:hypothetical protein
VSSNVSLHAGYNLALSQLHRHALLNTDRDNYVYAGMCQAAEAFQFAGLQHFLVVPKAKDITACHTIVAARLHGVRSGMLFVPTWHGINVLHSNQQTAWLFGLRLLTAPPAVDDDEEIELDL